MNKEEQIQQLVAEFTRQLMEVLSGLQAVPVAPAEATDPLERLDLAAFFGAIRPRPLFARLTTAQMNGHKDILRGMKKMGVPLSWAAYILATAYHETAQKMQPVREGLNASDAWRRRNLRYYPWYGRGHVQLTWEENYRRADQELGLGGALVANADLALQPDISVEVMVRGMLKGWFSGDRNGRHTLERHLPNRTNATRAQFKQARRIVNLMDRADLIAGHALVYQEALRKAGY
jgi:putative chitinase